MSDLSIPGVTDKYNTQKIIDALMQVARQPLVRKQADLDLENRQRTVWQDTSRVLGGLRDEARQLYGFQNPFNDRVAQSSDENVLTATATRQAPEETKQVTVQRVATADRFLSQSLPRGFTVDAGTYTFRVGEKEVRFAWKGGSLDDFVKALNAKGDSILGASVVADTPTSQVLLIESKITGASNHLTFQDAAADLGLKTGMLQRSPDSSRSFPLSPSAVTQWAKVISPQDYAIQNGALTLQPGAELSIPVKPSVALTKDMVLQLTVRVEHLPEPSTAPPPPLSGPSIPSTGGIDYGGIHIDSSPSQAPLPTIEQPKLPEVITDMQSLFMDGDGKNIPLPELPDSPDFQTIQVPIGEMASTLDAIDLRNRNTYRRITVKDITVYDKTQRGNYVATRPLDQAGDASLTMDGVQVRRPSNTVDDLLPGVTLTLKGPGTAPATVTVKHDVEGIKRQILSLVGAYNQIVTSIDVLTRKDQSIIDNTQFDSDDAKKKAQDNLGLLTGEITLQQLKNSLQLTMMSPYPTSLDRDMRLLAQIGISTDARPPGSAGIDKTRLRGYLEVDDAKLTAALQDHADAVKQLFGNDTDGDLVVDSGVAFKLDGLLRPYVQTGGILALRVSGLDSRISQTNKDITDLKAALDDKAGRAEAEVRPDGRRAGPAQQELPGHHELQPPAGWFQPERTVARSAVQLTINGERVDYSLESEKTLAEVARGVRAWLDQAGFMISGFRADGKDLLSAPAEQWAALPVSEVVSLEVEATHTGSLRIEHWRTVDTWLKLLERELGAGDDRAGGGPARTSSASLSSGNGPVPSDRESLAQLLGSVDDSLDGIKANPFLPQGSADLARFDALFRGQAPMQVVGWPPDRVAEARGLISRLRAALAARLADAERPDQALRRWVTRLRDQVSRLPEVSVLLQTGRDRDAMALVIGFTDTANSVIELLPFLPPDPERGRLLVELTPFFRELAGAFGSKDSVLIGDLLEYEITPRVQRLLPLLERPS